MSLFWFTHKNESLNEHEGKRYMQLTKEIKGVLAKTKNWKAIRSDGINSELLKSTCTFYYKVFVFQKIGRPKVILLYKQWKQMPGYKKHTPMLCTLIHSLFSEKTCLCHKCRWSSWLAFRCAPGCGCGQL